MNSPVLIIKGIEKSPGKDLGFMKKEVFSFEADITIVESDGSAASWPSISISAAGIKVFCESDLTDDDELMITFDDSEAQENKDVLVKQLGDNLYFLKFVESLDSKDLKRLIKECHGKSQTASLLPSFKKK